MAATKQAKIMVKEKESTRSRMPPWALKMVPKSLVPKWRLI